MSYNTRKICGNLLEFTAFRVVRPEKFSRNVCQKKKRRNLLIVGLLTRIATVRYFAEGGWVVAVMKNNTEAASSHVQNVTKWG
jgi:hypothetical protein